MQLKTAGLAIFLATALAWSPAAVSDFEMLPMGNTESSCATTRGLREAKPCTADQTTRPPIPTLTESAGADKRSRIGTSDSWASSAACR